MASSISPVPTVLNGTGGSLNHTLLNCEPPVDSSQSWSGRRGGSPQDIANDGSWLSPVTIPADQLPLAPTITPGWAVAGVVLLVAGTAQALVGIKMKRLHTFLSTALLASLGTTLLIVYVMTPPISDAVQGAYVVAVFCTGAALGGAAIVFPEITEGLGCVLGGFCLSMWLLTLTEGGLLVNSSAKIVFVLCFSLGAFAFYFSRFTRAYALIGCLSFAGATAAVLGIDAFSRAGLKEFWAYVWALNDNLFPPGAVTYPLTRGIRVELAATVLICVAGIVSQTKLWRVVQQHRARRDADRAEDTRHLREADESAGRQIEALNARERGQWEAVYGEGEHPPLPRPPMSPKSSADSGVGDLESEKRARHSHTTTRRTSASQSDAAEPVEMASLEGGPAVPPKPKPAAAEVVMVQDKTDGMVTVRVAKDDVPDTVAEDGDGDADGKKAWVVAADGEVRLATGEDRRRKRASKEDVAQPVIVPLPFRVPAAQDHEGQGDDDRSSFATFADEDERSAAPSRQNSLARRLSRHSADLLRSLSQRSKRITRDATQLFPSAGSREDLVAAPSRTGGRDDASSLAATVDGMSEADEDEADAATVRDDVGIRVQHAETAEDKAASTTAAADGPMAADVSVAVPAEGHAAEREDVAGPTPNGGASDDGKARSVAASVDSAPASLTKDRLPRPLSKIAMSYRTNEWAKHLSNAEAPEPEALQLSEYAPEEAPDVTEDEGAAPVNVQALQQTAENAAPPPRTAPAMPGHQAAAALSRPNSRHSVSDSQARSSVAAAVNSLANSYRNLAGGAANSGRRPSGLFVETIAEEGDHEASPQPSSPTSVREDSGSSGRSSTAGPARPPVPGVVSYSSPQTLIGRRDMFLRSKSQGALAGATSMASLPEAFANLNAMVPPPRPSSDDDFDADDLPMSQRKELLRHSSSLGRPASAGLYAPAAPAAPAPADAVPFDSHQPRRGSKHLPSPVAREAQLASFRSSLSFGLRSGGGGTIHAAAAQDNLSPVDTQRSYLMGQKEAEAARRETARAERDRTDRAFEERMRRGDLLEAHRDAMRRMQASARDGRG